MTNEQDPPRERTFAEAEADHEGRMAACFLAGHMPHLPDRMPRPRVKAEDIKLPKKRAFKDSAEFSVPAEPDLVLNLSTASGKKGSFPLPKGTKSLTLVVGDAGGGGGPESETVRKRRTAIEYTIGATYGLLTVTAKRPTKFGRGHIYTCLCSKCGGTRDFSSGGLYIKTLRGQGCGCRLHQRKLA